MASLWELVFEVPRWFLGFALLWQVPTLASGSTNASGLKVRLTVPARDEAASLPGLLGSLQMQDRQAEDVVVVDDSSSDDTTAVAVKFGASVLAAPPVPEGWTGKNWACWVGGGYSSEEAASPGNPSDVLTFVDADVTFADSQALGQLEASLVHGGGGLVSVQPYHRPGSPAEHMAAFFNLVAMMGVGCFALIPARTRAAFGPVLMSSRVDYELAGGHGAVRGEIVEDIALARRFVGVGLPVRILSGRGSIDFRMYPQGFSQLVEGFTKNLATGAGKAPFLAMLAVVVWVIGCIEAGFGVIQSPIVYFAYAIQIWWLLRKVGAFQWWVAAAYPVPLAVFLGVFARSMMLRWSRRPVQWKGRDVGVAK